MREGRLEAPLAEPGFSPLAWRSAIAVPGASDAGVVAERIEKALCSFKQLRAVRQDRRVAFERSWRADFADFGYQPLLFVDSGSVVVESAADGVTIRYRLGFVRMALAWAMAAIVIVGVRAATYDGPLPLTRLFMPAPFVWVMAHWMTMQRAQAFVPHWLKRSATAEA